MRVSMQPEKVTSIAERYPELNTGWLLTGEGDMLKNSEQDSKIVHSSSVPYEFVQAMIDERKRHDEMNAELIRQNGELIDILQERKKRMPAWKVLPDVPMQVDQDWRNNI